MTSRQSLYVMSMHAGIVLSVVVSVTILGVQGTLDSGTVTTVYGAAIGFGGATAAAMGSVGQAVNGKATIPTSELANREQTLRTAMVAAAGTEAHVVAEAMQIPVTKQDAAGG